MKQFLDNLELVLDASFTEVEKDEICEIYSEYWQDLDITEFRLFRNIKDCVFYTIDEVESLEDVIYHLVDKMQGTYNGEINVNLEDLTDDRYHLLPSGRVIFNFDC